MLFDWCEYLDIAEYLQKNESLSFSRESAQRCAISRAYYAVFGYARNYAVVNLGFTPIQNPEDKSKEHSLLRTHFKQAGKRDFAAKLDNLRQQRNLCDYENELTHIDNIIADALPKAKKMIEFLRKI